MNESDRGLLEEGFWGDPKGRGQEERARHQGGKQGKVGQGDLGDKGGPGHHAVCGLGPGLFAFNMKRIGPFKVGGDPSEETRLTPEIMGAS